MAKHDDFNNFCARSLQFLWNPPIQPSSPWQDHMLQVLQNQALDCNQQLLSNSHCHLKDSFVAYSPPKSNRKSWVKKQNWKKNKTPQVSRKSKTSTPTTKIRCQGATLSVALGEGCHTAHALTDAIALAAATRPVTPQGHTAIWILQWRSFWNMKRLKSFTSNSSCIVLKIISIETLKVFLKMV